MNQMSRDPREKRRSTVKAFTAVLSVILLTVITVAVMAGCAFIENFGNDVPGGNSVNGSVGTNSGKQFDVPSNGGYYPAN